MNRIELITRWIWKPGSLTVRIIEIRGGNMPARVRSELQHCSPPNLGEQTRQYEIAQSIAHGLGNSLPVPAPIDLGGEASIEGKITGLQLVDSRSSDDPNNNYISYYVEYDNGHKTEDSMQLKLNEISEPHRKMIVQLHRDVNQYVREYFWNTYGKGKVNPERWKMEKTELFISYRSSAVSRAEELFGLLGEYGDCAVFLPRMDRIDLQAGNWMDQLISMIKRCKVFIPLLTKDYLEGPFSRPELDLAMRRAFADNQRRIVPILIEGSTDDYKDHFLGGYHIVSAKQGINEVIINKVAHLALGISLNPYE